MRLSVVTPIKKEDKHAKKAFALGNGHGNRRFVGV